MNDDDITRAAKKVYPPNPSKSPKSSDETDSQPKKKEIKKVLTSEILPRKKSLPRRIAEYFTGDDIQSVGNYVLFEVILPAAKSLLFDAASQGLERKLFGNDSRRGGGANRGYTAYNRVGSAVINAAVNSRSQPVSNIRERPQNSFEDIVVASRAEAQEVLDQLSELIDNYGCVLLADLYEMINQPSTHIDQKWGWVELRGASVRAVSNGYLIILPRPVPID